MQDSRRRIWIEAREQRFGSFADLNAWLANRCRSLWEQVKHPDYRDLSVADVFEQERAHLMPMPTPFDGYVERAARVSSTCLVVVVQPLLGTMRICRPDAQHAALSGPRRCGGR